MIFYNKYLSTILRILAGLIFTTSATLKFMSIDAFDLYLFEHNLFSVPLTETITRLLIALEAIIGILLICNIYTRYVLYIALTTLSIFTIYLILLPALFDIDTTNCHCFGEKIILTRVESIIKNLIIIISLLFVSPRSSIRKKWHLTFTTTTCIIILTVAAVIKAPGYLYTIVHKEKIKINIPLYQQALKNSGKQKNFTHGKQIICMYSVHCKYCKKAALKLHLILKNNNLPNNTKAIFWSSASDSDIQNFFSPKNLPPLEHTSFRVDTFLSITNGIMPIFLFSDNGTITHAAKYISLNENDIKTFLKQSLQN
jgi:uncharacterized membrane protein YphA (DoxX/SURF4 family)